MAVFIDVEKIQVTFLKSIFWWCFTLKKSILLLLKIDCTVPKVWPCTWRWCALWNLHMWSKTPFDSYWYRVITFSSNIVEVLDLTQMWTQMSEVKMLYTIMNISFTSNRKEKTAAAKPGLELGTFPILAWCSTYLIHHHLLCFLIFNSTTLNGNCQIPPWVHTAGQQLPKVGHTPIVTEKEKLQWLNQDANLGPSQY